jgi:hypothetical protein
LKLKALALLAFLSNLPLMGSVITVTRAEFFQVADDAVGVRLTQAEVLPAEVIPRDARFK